MSRPERTCIGCRKRDSKSELLRLVWTSGAVLADPGQIAPGRGAYLHRRSGCVELAVRRRSVGRALRRDAGNQSGLVATLAPYVVEGVAGSDPHDA
ncbi:MAG TPA: YlxR family protein [Propionibacteriaceae bacterium]|nr:YlxR family protein [Propionibacteriaceae bacterium]